jgi:hypothetical protein
MTSNHLFVWLICMIKHNEPTTLHNQICIVLHEIMDYSVESFCIFPPWDSWQHFQHTLEVFQRPFWFLYSHPIENFNIDKNKHLKQKQCIYITHGNNYILWISFQYLLTTHQSLRSTNTFKSKARLTSNHMWLHLINLFSQITIVIDMSASVLCPMFS